jgi:hypothetical protein
MSLSELAALVRRHILAAALVLVVAVGVAYHIKHTPPTFEDNATIVLAPPDPVLAPPYANPYAPPFGPSLIITGELMVKWMNGAQGQQLLQQAGVAKTFSVALINFSDQEYPLYGEPNLTISGIGEDPVSAHSALVTGKRVFEQGLVSQEEHAHVPQTYRIATHVIGESGPVVQLGSSKRTYAGLAALTIIALYMILIILDRRSSLLRRFRVPWRSRYGHRLRQSLRADHGPGGGSPPGRGASAPVPRA